MPWQGTEVQALQAAKSAEPVDGGYINGSTRYYEQIEAVEAVPDRLIIYHGSLLHSGIIPERMAFSSDPRQGRLTANFFLLGRRLTTAPKNPSTAKCLESHDFTSRGDPT